MVAGSGWCASTTPPPHRTARHTQHQQMENLPSWQREDEMAQKASASGKKGKPRQVKGEAKQEKGKKTFENVLYTYLHTKWENNQNRCEYFHQKLWARTKKQDTKISNKCYLDISEKVIDESQPNTSRINRLLIKNQF
jgi:hypothetical protein